MHIQSDSVRMGASRAYRESKRGYSSLTTWNNATRSVSTSREETGSSTQSQYFSVGDFLDRARNAYNRALEDEPDSDAAKKTGENGETEPVSTDTDNRADAMDRFFLGIGSMPQVQRMGGWDEKLRALEQIRQQTLNYLLQLLFGDRYARGDYQVYGTSGEQPASYGTAGGGSDQGGYGQSEAAGMGGTYYSYSSYSEYESTAFSGTGTVVTADGREISFGINVSMSRSFVQTFENQVNFGEAQLKDPLVINLDGNVAEVSDQKFFFDIDADGEIDEISMLAPGSGYLALDRNGDGEVNDGSELFGTASGNGFADLAAFDEDGNGWIDEADSVFAKLKIWTMDADGTSKLYGLAEKGVGAIYLGSEATQFSLNDAVTNETNAVIRRTGMFLYESGEAGTVQQLDLAT